MTAVHTFHSRIKDVQQNVHEEVKHIQVMGSRSSARLVDVVMDAILISLPRLVITYYACASLLDFLMTSGRQVRCKIREQL